MNRFLRTNIGEIRIFSRYEKKQDDMHHNFQARMLEVANKIEFYIGDVRNKSTLKYAMKGVDHVIHAVTINKMAEKYDMSILYLCHPRSRKRLEASGFVLDKRVIQHEPLDFHDYDCLQLNAFAVVSDSGTLPEESSFNTSVGHSFPAI